MTKKTDLKDSCAFCEVIECIDLFNHEDDDILVGGELYIYRLLSHSKMMDEELSMHICSNGILIKCACFIISTLNKLVPKDYLIIISNEIVSDMKASFYLAMSGHYRQAILIQRCVFENFLYGVYFYTEYEKFSKNIEEKDDIYKKFLQWNNGGFRKSVEYLLEIIQKGRVISEAENKEWWVLFKELSQYVHTIRKTPTGKAIKHSKSQKTSTGKVINLENVETDRCYSEVEFNTKNIIEWSNYYQKVFFIILYKLLSLYPTIKKEYEGKAFFKLLRAEFRDKRKELKNPYLDEILKMRIRKTC